MKNKVENKHNSKQLNILDVSDSEIKISNSNLYGSFDGNFITKEVICIENPNPNYPITVGKIYPVLDVVSEPNGEYIIKCDDGRKLVSPRYLFNDI